MAGMRFEINGQAVTVDEGDPHRTLLQWLRAQGLTGTKEGCAEGECGACAVALVQRDAAGRAVYQPINSCLLPLAEMHGRAVVTVEGVRGRDGELHPVQQAMVECGGSQCGYCTPGFVMSLFCEYYRPDRDGYDPESISGNLCRCTGYRPIVDAAKRLTAPLGDDPWLRRLDEPPQPLLERPPSPTFVRPTSLEALLDEVAAHPDATIIAGGTDLMVYVNQRDARYRRFVSLAGVEPLHRFEIDADAVTIGASLSLSHLEHHLRDLDEPTTALEQLLPLYSSRLIRNRATLGGSLATASPIGDAAPVLLALGARVTIAQAGSRREVPLEEFFVDYRKTVLEAQDVIVSVSIPRPWPAVQRFYKVSKRVMDDISTVAAAFGLDLDEQGRVQRLTISYGGVAATPIRASALEALAKGKPWTEATLQRLIEASAEIGTPMTDHRGSGEYRRAMIARLLERFFVESRSCDDARQVAQ